MVLSLYPFLPLSPFISFPFLSYPILSFPVFLFIPFISCFSYLNVFLSSPSLSFFSFMSSLLSLPFYFHMCSFHLPYLFVSFPFSLQFLYSLLYRFPFLSYTILFIFVPPHYLTVSLLVVSLNAHLLNIKSINVFPFLTNQLCPACIPLYRLNECKERDNMQI